MHDAGMKGSNLRVKFVALWLSLQAIKIALAVAVPVLVDEAYYAWEGQHLAWAYSDLPGLSAWLARLGVAWGGQHALALRAPFLLIGALIPWQVVRISSRWFGAEHGWRAGLLALLMPLSGLLGVLALPDVPLVFASLLCLDGIAQCRERVDRLALLTLASGLIIGAFAHYRFALVIAAGLLGMLCDVRSRALLRDVRVWLVLLLGAVAWLPLLGWNLAHAEAGLKFQLLERNPWAFHLDAAFWLPIQMVLVTPLLFILLVITLYQSWWRWRSGDDRDPWGLIFGVAALSVPGYFALGFFADSERVSFHWPLAGWLVLIVAAPVLLSSWRQRMQRLLFASVALGLVCASTFLCVAATPVLRQSLADNRIYPADFAGWQEIGHYVRRLKITSDTRIVADNFALAAQLAFALNRPDIAVLDNPLNHKHGRALQLELWGLHFDDLRQANGQPVLLVIDDTATALKARLRAYHRYCGVFGPLPPADILTVDHGRRRFLLYRFDGNDKVLGCTTPALAWIDTPGEKAKIQKHFTVHGWAFKDGVGIARIEITLDGKVVSVANTGISMPNVAEYWHISTDPNQPRVGFSAQVDASALAPGKHWLGLTVFGADGSREPWPEQSVTISP